MFSRRSTYTLIFFGATAAVTGVFAWRLTSYLGSRLLLVSIAAAVFGWLLLRMVLAHLDRPSRSPVPAVRASLVLCVFDEDPDVFTGALEAISKQRHLPDSIWIVDDGSTTRECFDLAQEWATEMRRRGARVVVERLAENRGKRHAQAVAFGGDSDAQIFITCDSDTHLEPTAVEEILRPFADPEIFGVSGLLTALNRTSNLLTRLTDLELTSTFLMGRAAMSRIGCVMVTNGGLAAYRSSVCRDHLEEYLNERFLGAVVRNGDDRKLSQYALLRGKLVFQETAVGQTLVPSSWGQLTRQRLRWFTSFYRGTWWVARHMPPSRPAFWVNLVFALMFLLQSLAIASLFLFVDTIDWTTLGTGYLSWSILSSFPRRARYLGFKLSTIGPREQGMSFLLSPLVSVLNVLFLTPLRYAAILRLRSWGWGTRGPA